MKPSSEIRREFALIHALSSTDKPDITWLHEQTGIPRSTIARLLAVLRREFGMTIHFVRDPGFGRGQGRYGYYMISDWGIVDQAAFQNRYGNFSFDEVVHAEKKVVGG